MTTATKEEILKLSHIGEAEVTLDKLALELKASLVSEAELVKEITNPFEAEVAADSIRRIKELVTDVKNAHKTIKAPVLEIGRKIDAVAKDFNFELEREKTRVSRLLGNYQAAEREKQEKAKREAQRKEREESLRMEAKLESAKSEEEYDKAREEGIQKVAEARNEIADTKRNEPKGVQLRKTIKWEVEDIEALFKARPDLVKLEPNAELIRATVKFNKNIPGLRIWTERKAVV